MEYNCEDLKGTLEFMIRLSTKIALKVEGEERKNYRQEKLKRKVKNTKLLLNNYDRLLKVAKGIKLKSIKDNNAVDILSELEYITDEKEYINNILISPMKSALVIKYIDDVFEMFRLICDMSKGKERNFFNIINDIYFGNFKNNNEIAQKYKIKARMFYNYVRDSHSMLSKMIFGIDDLSLN